MSKISITIVEQKALREEAKNEILRLEKLFADEKVTNILDDFKNQFNICETAYKVILTKHQEAKGKTDINYLKLDMRQAPQALSFAGYTFNRNLLNELFGAKSSRGKTVKKLRDGITHGVDENAVTEILNRKDELFGYMDAFVDTVKHYDDIVAA